MAELIGQLGGVIMLLGWIIVLVFAGFWPLIAFFSMRHLKGIRRELDRMNDNLEKRWLIEGDVNTFKKAAGLNIR